MVEVLSVLSLATKQIKQGRFSTLFYCHICLISNLAIEKFAKKLLRESEIEDVLHRLDRLTLDEARMTGTVTLQVIHGLVSDLKVVIGGTEFLPYPLLIAHRPAWIDGTRSMDDIWQALGMPYIWSISMRLTVHPSHDPRDDMRDKQDET